MTFFSMVARGLARRPVRTSLTVAGIAVGVAAVIALVGLSNGLVSSWTKGMRSRGTDIVIHNMRGTVAPKPFPEATRDRIQDVPTLAATSKILVELISVEDSEMMVVSGREWGTFSWDNLKLVAGRMPRDPAEPVVVLGQTAAEVLKKKPGDSIQVETEELTVVGIVDGGAVVENGSVILSLQKLQQLTGNEGKISAIDVRLRPGLDEAARRTVCAELSKRVPEARAELASEQLLNTQGYRLIHAMSWGTSLLAMIVGVLGVMNTMMMTVFERKQEICILLAIGWRPARILRMILLESALLGLCGGILGCGFGWIGTEFLKRAPAIRGMLEPDTDPTLVATAILLALVVGVVSGLYPAWRSSRLAPSLALHA